MALRVLWFPNGLRHVNLDVSMAPCRKDNIFEILGVQHANWRRTKYDVYTCVCLLLCFISMFACLDLGVAMLGALRVLELVGLWGHLLVFGCIRPTCGLFGCNHMWDPTPWCWFSWCIPLFSLRAMLCLPCLFCATPLALLVSLHLCILVYMFMHESICLLVSSSLITIISCRFTPVFDTRAPESL